MEGQTDTVASEGGHSDIVLFEKPNDAAVPNMLGPEKGTCGAAYGADLARHELPKAKRAGWPGGNPWCARPANRREATDVLLQARSIPHA